MNMESNSRASLIRYNSREEFYKTPFGCLAMDQTLKVTIALAEQLSPWHVQLGWEEGSGNLRCGAGGPL